MPPAGSPSPTGRLRLPGLAGWPASLLAVLVCTALLGSVQFSFDGLSDGDSYFHTRAARELDRHGIQRQFPQTVHSTWSARYSDKDFLFHVLLIPFQRLARPAPERAPIDEDLVTPGKQAVVALTLAFFLALAWGLHALGVKLPWFWVVLFFVTEVNVLLRLLPARPELLGSTLLVLEIALCLRRRWLGLAVVGALHAWSHSSFVLLPVLAGLAAVASLLRGERPTLSTFAAAAGGPLVGSVLHPYFPHDLSMIWDQVAHVALGAWWGSAIPLDLFGPELDAGTTRPFLRAFPALAPAAAGIVAFLAASRRRLSTEGLALVLMAGLLLVASFLSSRFFAVFFPVVILLDGRLWTELLRAEAARDAPGCGRTRLHASLALLVLCLGAGLARGNVSVLRRHVRSMTTLDSQRPAVRFLGEQARPEEIVYHNFWWDFNALYHYRPEGRYVVALDPVFFRRHDPARFAKSLDAYRGRSEDLYRTLANDFGAGWIYLAKVARHEPFFRLIRADPRFRIAYEDSQAVIVRLR